MVQLGGAIAQMVAPVLAGVLVDTIGIQNILLIDLGTFFFAIVMLLFVRIPNPSSTGPGQAERKSLWREAAFGWTYLTARPGLWALLIFIAAINFTWGNVQVLVTPLVLSFAPATALGTVLSVGGVGMLLGSLFMSIWGGPKRRVQGVLGFGLVLGCTILLGGLNPNVPLVAAAAFILLFNLPIINGCGETIFQSKVPQDVQGRVLATRNMVIASTLPLAYLVAGLLADEVFEPALAIGGPLAGSVGRLIGAGPGRGIGFLFMILGLFTMGVTVAGGLYRRLWRLDEELPDMIGDETGEVVKDSAVSGSES
jgi:hypothetical protein